MYCLITDQGAPPTVERKYECVHKVGRRERNQGNSCRNNRHERPFK